MSNYFSRILQNSFYGVYKRIFIPPAPNLIGDRDLEYAFIASNIPAKQGNALDFGSGKSNLSLISALRGYEVTSLDLLPNRLSYKHKNIKFIQKDIMNTNFPNNFFDLIINCSSIEHVGLPGRYNVAEKSINGDLIVMSKLSQILKKAGIMLLTIPVGVDVTIGSYHRIYGKKRLPKLLNKYNIRKELYWGKSKKNIWVEIKKSPALQIRGSKHYYGIGCYVLSK